MKTRIAAGLAGLSLLLSSRASASCSGQSGADLDRCLEGESSMIQDRVQQETAEENAGPLHFVRGKRTFTLTTKDAGWSFEYGVRAENACAALKADGTYVEKHVTITCKKGHADGKAIHLDDEGKKRREESYRAGVGIGSTEFDEAGHKTEEVVFAGKGTLVGKKFDPNGTVVMRWEYKNDQRHGEWLEDGKTFRYRDGKLVP